MSNRNRSSYNIDKLALAIGNSRLHWAYFEQDNLIETWDTPHLKEPIVGDRLPSHLFLDSSLRQVLETIPVYIASVVPQQTELWQNYHDARIVTLEDIELSNLYPTLGIDRALAIWGGGETYGYPCLIIDGGTALTFTAADPQRQLIGGAILPGLRSQFLALNQKTAALPEVALPANLPPRWALDTNNAIASGIVYSVLAGIYSYIENWQKRYPNSQIILTGGDGEILSQYLARQYPSLKTICDRNLIFYGINLIARQA
ncbi:MAG: pantothenate kinase [Cyanobacteria bacterium P01_G01_bin.19]